MAQPAANAPLLRDVFDIKTSISTSDFVLKLAEAVTDEGAEYALRDHVVTDRLLANFDEALGLIKAALDGNTSYGLPRTSISRRRRSDVRMGCPRHRPLFDGFDAMGGIT